MAPRSTEEGETAGGRSRRGGISCSPALTVPVFLVRAGLPHALRELPGRAVGENRTLQQKGTPVSLNPPPLRHQETGIQRRSMRSHSNWGQSHPKLSCLIPVLYIDGLGGFFFPPLRGKRLHTEMQQDHKLFPRLVFITDMMLPPKNITE